MLCLSFDSLGFNNDSSVDSSHAVSTVCLFAIQFFYPYILQVILDILYNLPSSVESRTNAPS